MKKIIAIIFFMLFYTFSVCGNVNSNEQKIFHEMSNAFTHFNLGLKYDEGKEVSQDYKKAFFRP